jgi:hypothetical protein
VFRVILDGQCIGLLPVPGSVGEGGQGAFVVHV